MAVKFHTKIFQAEGKKATGIKVPPQAIADLGGGKKPAVTVTLNDFTYRTTVGVYGEDFLIPLSHERREAAGLAAGDDVAVILELDTAPRTVELPDDLRAALSAKAGALEAYEAAAPSRKKEFVRQVNDAKTQETRERRIAKIVATLGAS